MFMNTLSRHVYRVIMEGKLAGFIMRQIVSIRLLYGS